MRIALVGADFEENLGVGMIAAVARNAGHQVQVEPFDGPDTIERVAARVVAAGPEVVGLSMQFQHRGHEFLRLARLVRAVGCKARIVAGGQFATLAWREVLSPPNAVDAVVLHEGERGFVELLEALQSGGSLDGVAGLALPGPDGPRRTAGRALVHDLDSFPFPARYRPHSRHLGVPFVPIMGSRGCWGSCSFCSITSFYRDARASGGGRTFRERSPEDVAEEMAALWHRAGEPVIFCFHDDTFLRPRPADTLERLRAIRRGLDDRGVGKIGIVAKCRPDNLTTDLARSLAELGVIRLYVGVENASERGAAHLHRARQTQHVRQALEACRAAGIFVCYNLLVFEPDTRLEDLRANIDFIRAHADHPVNFCRAEPYSGTPMQLDLAQRQALSGSYLGWDYRLSETRAELMFRISAAAFRQRNFDPAGVANRYMGLGYSLKVLRHFYPVIDQPGGPGAELARRVRELNRSISLETAELLEETLELATALPLDDEDRVMRATALLGLRVAEADAARHSALDRLYADLEACVASRPKRKQRVRRRLADLTKGLALGASLATASACDQVSVVDPVPEDGGVEGDIPQVVDPAPADFGVVDPLPPDAGVDYMVVDPAPIDLGVDARPDFGVVDPPPPDAGMDAAPDALVVDPPPPDLGLDAFPDVGVSDPPPPDFGPVDPPPPTSAWSRSPTRGPTSRPSWILCRPTRGPRSSTSGVTRRRGAPRGPPTSPCPDLPPCAWRRAATEARSWCTSQGARRR